MLVLSGPLDTDTTRITILTNATRMYSGDQIGLTIFPRNNISSECQKNVHFRFVSFLGRTGKRTKNNGTKIPQWKIKTYFSLLIQNTELTKTKLVPKTRTLYEEIIENKRLPTSRKWVQTKDASVFGLRTEIKIARGQKAKRYLSSERFWGELFR